jgi:hypothetical protein
MPPDVITVAVSRVDGGLTVLRVIVTEYSQGVPRWTIDPTPEYIDAIIAKHNWQDGLAPVSWRVVPNDFVDESTDRYFRNAWKDGGDKPGVDMPKAREIHRDKLRVMRLRPLEALDTAYMRADEVGDQQEKRRIATQKQALRDVTADPRIDAAATPEELKAVIPDALAG